MLWRAGVLDRLGHFRILGPLGGGGMADVFLARRDDPLAPLVALKCLRPSLARDPELLLAFQDEARALSHVADPRVVRLLESGACEGTCYLALEYVAGPDLAHLVRALRSRGRLAPIEAVLAVADDLLAGLHAAHEARDERGRPLHLVHRDVSPHNVLVSPSGICKLADFGLARFERQAHHTQGNDARGKLSYLAPEQLNASGLDRRVDIWAAALVIHELATLDHPLAGRTDLETVHRICGTRVPPLARTRRDVPPELDLVLELAFAPTAAARFETARAFREALRCAMPVSDGALRIARLVELGFPDGLPPPAFPSPLSPARVHPARTRSRLLHAAAGALVGAALATGASLLAHRLASPAPSSLQSTPSLTARGAACP